MPDSLAWTLASAAGLIGVVAFYCGARRQRLLRRPLPAPLSLTATAALLILSLALFASSLSLAVSIYALSVLAMIILSVLPFLALVGRAKGPRHED